MSSEQHNNEASRQGRLPFEPTTKKTRKKSAKAESVPSSPNQNKGKEKATLQSAAVPAIVSQRMGRRMAFFCGLPTAMAMLTFIASYVVVSHHWFKLPNTAVVIMSMGFFGLGVLGLSYGVLSASWDEEIPGSLIGWNEFVTNWGRMTAAWRSRSEIK